jgi:hypothetical protein
MPPGNGCARVNDDVRVGDKVGNGHVNLSIKVPAYPAKGMAARPIEDDAIAVLRNALLAGCERGESGSKESA